MLQGSGRTRLKSTVEKLVLFPYRGFRTLRPLRQRRVRPSYAPRGTGEIKPAGRSTEFAGRLRRTNGGGHPHKPDLTTRKLILTTVPRMERRNFAVPIPTP